MIARSKRCRRLRPAASIHRWTARQGRSAPGTSEHKSLDSASGSIGNTRSGNRPSCRGGSPRGRARCRGDIGANIGDRDDEMPATGIGRIRSGSAHTASSKSRASLSSIVTSASSRRSARPADRPAAPQPPRRARQAEIRWNVEGGDRHPADRSGRVRRPRRSRMRRACRIGATTAPRQSPTHHREARPHHGRAPGIRLVAAIDRDHLAAIARPAEDADDAARRFVEAVDDFGVDLARAAADQPASARSPGASSSPPRQSGESSHLVTRRPGNRPGEGTPSASLPMRSTGMISGSAGPATNLRLAWAFSPRA